MVDVKYEMFKIKEYDLWDLYLHMNQFPYVGRTYAWAKNPDAKKLTDMSLKEAEELHTAIIPEVNNALVESFEIDWLNLAISGNTTQHLHAHLIPRYNSPRKFYGEIFEDPNPKGNYSPYPKKELSRETLLKIVADIKLFLE